MDPDAPQSDSTESIETPPDPAPAAVDDQASPPDDPADPPIEPVPVTAAPPSVNEAGVDSDQSDAAIDPPVDAPISAVPSSPALSVSVPVPDSNPSSVNTPTDNSPANGTRRFAAQIWEHLGLAARQRKKQRRLERLLAHAAAKGHVNCPETQILLEVSRREAEAYLEELVASGHLSRRGQKSKTEYWFVG